MCVLLLKQCYQCVYICVFIYVCIYVCLYIYMYICVCMFELSSWYVCINYLSYAYISNTWNIKSKCSSIPLIKGKDGLGALPALQTEFRMMAMVSSDSSRLMPIHRIYDQMPWPDSWAIGPLSESKPVEAALQGQCSLTYKHSPLSNCQELG